MVMLLFWSYNLFALIVLIYLKLTEGKSKQIYNDFMRKLEKQMNFALSNKSNWRGSNTVVEYNDSTNCSSVYLHGHNIATLDHNTNALKISSCGYETVTTKSRLNAILEERMYGCRVYQKNWEWFVSKYNQTVDFIDGMIILDSYELQTV